MNWTSTRLAYDATGYFSPIILDYLNRAPALAEFYSKTPDREGIKAAIDARKDAANHRHILVDALRKQYASVTTDAAVLQNIERLGEPTCFTITTAHQPAIFTGTLYFVYKILHVIRLAAQYRQEWPQYYFVPVFYMGSEDADLDELGHIWLNNEKLVWGTAQKGAVGRMKTAELSPLLQRIEGELSVQPFGEELMALLRQCYLDSPDLQTATFRLINALFGRYGLIVLIPDNSLLKRLMIPVFKDDLLNQAASDIASSTISMLAVHYKVQARPREINLFYLKEDIRERIVKEGDAWRVTGTDIRFSRDELLQELETHPDRFSPNVILRGLFQETILPNIAFVGGGGELAYWLELKDIFEHYQVPYPVLILRNSFMLVEKKWADKIARLGFQPADFFLPEHQLGNRLVKRETALHLQLESELDEVKSFYARLKSKTGRVDTTLEQHVEALRAKATRPLYELEKKMLRAEKRKFKDQLRQIQAVKVALFPRNSLQERLDNFMPWYARYGRSFIDMLYTESLCLEQEFILLVQNQ